MSKATISRNLDRYNVLSSPGSATAPAPVSREVNPSGNVLLRSLTIRYDATISGTSTPTRVTNGHIFYLNALTVETDKHLKIVNQIDGLLLYTMNQFDFHTTGVATALTATPADTDTPQASWVVPFSLFRGIRPYDTNLDMLKSRMTVTTQFGAVTNLWTQAGGTPLVVTNAQSIEGKILNAPYEKDGDGGPGTLRELPDYVRAFDQKLEVITATETRHQINLPFGDSIWRRIFITQRNTSTKIEMSNVIAATAEISLYLNNVPIVDRRLFRDIQAENKLTYALENMPTGVCVLDFDADEQERIQDMLWALTSDSGSLTLYIDVTSQTNGGILLGFDRLKPIPAAAIR